jgi:hypothetical protein
MPHTRLRLRLPLAMLGAATVIALSPLVAIAGQGPQQPAQPQVGQGILVVEQVQNGPVFGAEFKYTQMNRQDVYLLGGYAGVIFDSKLLIGGAGYWQVDTSHYNGNGYDDYYYGYNDNHYNDYYGVNGYGGLLLEWYALRSPVVSVSARGLIGGGVATVGANDYLYMNQPADRHGSMYPPVGGYYAYDQAYFVFEPQVNVSLRLVPGVAMVGGVGYRVIGWANGWEDQIQGVTGTFAIRFGGK